MTPRRSERGEKYISLGRQRASGATPWGWAVVLVIVDPGWDIHFCFRSAAERLLFWHSYEWSSRKCQTLFGSQNHHVEGTYVMDHKFEFVRGFSPNPNDGRAFTTRTLREGGSIRVGAPCRYCEGTGVRLFAFAENPCPMCHGEGVQLAEDVGPDPDPAVFPMAFINLDDFSWLPSAAVTPDGRWHDRESVVRGWGRDWREQLQRFALDYRHCYGVRMAVKW